MARAMTPAMLAAILAEDVQTIMLCEMEFLTGPVQAWSGIGDLTTLGRTFQGVGAFGSVSPIEESGQTIPQGMELELNGVDEGIVAMSSDRTQYRGRAFRLWLGAMEDDPETLIDDPVLIFAGRMQYMSGFYNGSNSAITLTVDSRLVNLRRPRIIRYVHEDQQARYPGDLAFEGTATLAERPLYWGGPGPASPGGHKL